MPIRTSAQIRADLAVRQGYIQVSLDGLRNEISAATGLKLGGRPLPASVSRTAVRNAGFAVAGGLALGALLGLRARSQRRPDPDDGIDLVRVRLATLLDEAAGRVARGTSAEDALRATLRDAPIVYSPSPATAAAHQAKSSVRQAVDMAVKSAAGFALKLVMDEISAAVSGKRSDESSAKS
jgi:hypothetical protein